VASLRKSLRERVMINLENGTTKTQRREVTKVKKIFVPWSLRAFVVINYA